MNAADRELLTILEKELPRIKAARTRQNLPQFVESDRKTSRQKDEDEEHERERKKLEEKFFTGKIKSGSKILGHDPLKSVYYHPQFNPYGMPPPGMPWEDFSSDDDGDTDEDVKAIPMPLDTPSPSSNEPEQSMDTKGQYVVADLNPIASQEEVVKVSYEAAPVIRDLTAETTAFVPNAIKRKLPTIPDHPAQISSEEQRIEISVPVTEESMDKGDFSEVNEGIEPTNTVKRRRAVVAAPDV